MVGATNQPGAHIPVGPSLTVLAGDFIREQPPRPGDAERREAVVIMGKASPPGERHCQDGEQDDGAIYIEINERQFAGHDLVSEARLTGNMLTLVLREPAEELHGAADIVLTYEDTPENKSGIEQGAFRVLGDLLTGGHA